MERFALSAADEADVGCYAVADMWLVERTEDDPSVMTGTAELYRDYLNWALARRANPWKRRAWANRLTDLGYARFRNSTTRFMVGIRLKGKPPEGAM